MSGGAIKGRLNLAAPAAGGGGGRNYGSVGYGTWPPAIHFTLASGEVALISWVRTGSLGDVGALSIEIDPGGSGGTITDSASVEHDGTDWGVGQGWVTGVGDFTAGLTAMGAINVDIDPGTGQQASSG